MDIIVSNLWKGGNKWEYSKKAEEAALRYFCFRTGQDTNNITLSSGYCPEYDAIVDGEKFEVKFSTSKMLNIEFGKSSSMNAFAGSALSQSQAKYYLYISQGRSKNVQTGGWDVVGKMRLYNKNYLISRVMQKVENPEEIKVHEADMHGPESYYVSFDPKKEHLEDKWYTDIPVITVNDRVVGFTIPDVQL